MAIKYSNKDNVWYCTNAERLALDVTKLEDTSKYCEYDNSFALYMAMNGQWYKV